MPHPGAGAPTGGGGGQVAVAVVDADQAARSRLAMQLGQGATPFASINDLASRLGLDPGRDRARARRSPAAPSWPRSSSCWPPAATSAPSWSPTSCPPTCSSGRCARASRTCCRPRSSRRSWPRPWPGWPPGLVMAAPVPAGARRHRRRRRARSGHHRVLDQGRRRQVGRRHQPGRHPGPAQRPKPVVLVDADLQFGDIAVMLKLSPQHTDRRRRRARSTASTCRCCRACSSSTSRRACWSCPRRSSRPSPTRSAPPRWCASSRCCAPFCSFVVIDTPGLLQRRGARA